MSYILYTVYYIVYTCYIIYIYILHIISRNMFIDPWQDFVATEAFELLCEQPLLFQDVTSEWFLSAECRGGIPQPSPAMVMGCNGYHLVI